MIKPATEQINKVESKNRKVLYIYQTKKKTFNS